MSRSLLLLSLVLAACSSKEDPVAGDVDAGPDGALNAIPEWDKPVTPPADPDAEKKRTECGYAAGALPAETQGKSRPMGKDIPVDTIVIVMMENRSFDHYFQKAKEHGLTEIEVAPAISPTPTRMANRYPSSATRASALSTPPTAGRPFTSRSARWTRWTAS